MRFITGYLNGSLFLLHNHHPGHFPQFADNSVETRDSRVQTFRLRLKLLFFLLDMLVQLFVQALKILHFGLKTFDQTPSTLDLIVNVALFGSKWPESIIELLTLMRELLFV